MAFALGIAALALVGGCLWQVLAERADRRRYRAPGCFRDGLHIHCTGSGRPVVLEAGIGASSVSWELVQRPLSGYARVCAYDRRGLAWSACPNEPRTVESFLNDLRTVVTHAGAPAILVGHSFGGLLVRLYAAAYPHDVAGLVLVDPALTAEWADPTPERLAMLRRGIALSNRGGLLARTGFVRLALTLLSKGARPLARIFAQASGTGASPVTQKLVGEVRKLPPELWPIIQSHWCRPESFRGMAQHLDALPRVAAAAAKLQPPPVPTVIISPQEFAEHVGLGKHVIASDSGHWVHLDRPDLVVNAVRSLLDHG